RWGAWVWVGRGAGQGGRKAGGGGRGPPPPPSPPPGGGGGGGGARRSRVSGATLREGFALHRIRDATSQNFTCGACSSALRSSTPTSKKSFGVNPSGPASSTAGNCWIPVLYSCTALLKKRRAAAILFSRSESWPCN